MLLSQAGSNRQAYTRGRSHSWDLNSILSSCIWSLVITPQLIPPKKGFEGIQDASSTSHFNCPSCQFSQIQPTIPRPKSSYCLSIFPAACRVIFSKKKKISLHILFCLPTKKITESLHAQLACYSSPTSSVSCFLAFLNVWRFSACTRPFGVYAYSNMWFFITRSDFLSLLDWGHLTTTQSFSPQPHQASPLLHLLVTVHTWPVGPPVPYYSPMQLAMLWPVWFSSSCSYIWHWFFRPFIQHLY